MLSLFEDLPVQLSGEMWERLENATFFFKSEDPSLFPINKSPNTLEQAIFQGVSYFLADNLSDAIPVNFSVYRLVVEPYQDSISMHIVFMGFLFINELVEKLEYSSIEEIHDLIKTRGEKALVLSKLERGVL